jgi:hypothetical protein
VVPHGIMASQLSSISQLDGFYTNIKFSQMYFKHIFSHPKLGNNKIPLILATFGE